MNLEAELNKSFHITDLLLEKCFIFIEAYFQTLF